MTALTGPWSIGDDTRPEPSAACTGSGILTGEHAGARVVHGW